MIVISLSRSTHEVARRLAAEGGTVVLLADQDTAEEAGRLASELEGGRPAVFIDPDPEAVAAFVGELFG